MGLINYDIEQLQKDVYTKKITVHNLPVELYEETADLFKAALKDGYSAVFQDFRIGSEDFKTLKNMTQNVELFSAAKTYQQVKELSALSKTNAWSDYLAKSDRVLDDFNHAWLNTELVTTTRQAQSARKWNEFEASKDRFKLLQYDAIIDDNTSDICRPLDGITLPVDDPFWRTHAPLNHFRCRCIMRRISQFEGIDQSSKEDVAKAEAAMEKEMQPLFKMNPGIERVVFLETGKNKHPYFDIADKDKALAKKNFNFPLTGAQKEKPVIKKENNCQKQHQ